jgi:hypothetical protein
MTGQPATAHTATAQARQRQFQNFAGEKMMKRTTILGSVAAGLLAAAASTPAWAQAATYPEGTDCSAIQNSASKTECMNQMDESRQNPVSGNPEPSTGNAAPGSRTVAPGSADDASRATPGTNDGSQPAGTAPSGSTNNTPGGNTGTTTP